MSITEDFYSHFPSFNANSKENQRNKKISTDYSNYLKTLSPKTSTPPRKKKQKESRTENDVSDSGFYIASSPTTPGSPPASSVRSSSSMDIIFSSEERNKQEKNKIDERRKTYQISLQRQIEEQRIKKMKELEKQKRDEEILERRLQRQLEGIRLQNDSQHEKVVERISLSENEKESYNQAKVSKQTTSKISSNNDVYRYFSQSAKHDTELFNYKRLFSDLIMDRNKHEVDLLDQKRREHLALKLLEPLKTIPSKEVEIKKPEPTIDYCPSCTHAKCGRCRKKFEMYCSDCGEHDKVSPEITNQREIEYDEPELPFGPNQQVVVYRPSEQDSPFSFNVDPNSMFYKDAMMENLKKYSDMKFANYLKHYGDLRKVKLQADEMKSKTEEPAKKTGAIPKQPLEPRIIDKSSNKVLSPTNQSDLDEIISNAQYTVITQIGFAKKQLGKS